MPVPRFASLRALAPATLLALALAAPPLHAAESRAFVLETDFSTGSFSAVNLATKAPACDVASVFEDAGLRYHAGRVYVVNRLGADNIQELDPVTYATLLQFSVGNGANPHDIAFASPTKAYVTRYETTDLWIVNPQTGAKTGSISLAAFADADGIPEMDREQMVGPLLFVSLQRVNRNAGFTPTDSALVAVVDTRADTVVDCDPALPGTQAILLPHTNPVTAFQFDPATSRLLIGCAGNYGVLDGGVDRVDPVALRADGTAATEDSLGGDIGDVVWKDGSKAYAIVSDASFNTSLVSWSPQTGRRLATLYAPGGFTLADAALDDRGGLWVANSSTTTPGLHVFDTATDTPVGGTIACALPPAAIAFDDAAAGVAGVPPAAPVLALGAPRPDPARAQVALALALPAAGAVDVRVFDAAGRAVRTLASGWRAAGAGTVAWDLRDAGGRRVAPGLYLVRARAGALAVVRRVAVVW